MMASRNGDDEDKTYSVFSLGELLTESPMLPMSSKIKMVFGDSCNNESLVADDPMWTPVETVKRRRKNTRQYLNIIVKEEKRKKVEVEEKMNHKPGREIRIMNIIKYWTNN